MQVFTHLESSAAEETMKDKQGSHGQPSKITKRLTILTAGQWPGYFYNFAKQVVFIEVAFDAIHFDTYMIIYLQVDLLSVRWLRGECSIDRLLEGEGKGGGDPGAARGAQLGTFDGESWKW